MADFLIPVRRAALAELKADAALLALVPAAQIHPQSTPAKPVWPFVRYGAPSSSPREAACLNGAEMPIAVHSFAKPRVTGQQTVETAEDHAGRIGAAVVTALHRKTLTITGGTARIRWTGSQLMHDGDEADAYHHIATFAVRVFA